MKQSLQLKLGQQLTMTPQLQQAIRLLQLSTMDLQQEIQQAIDSNPMLEVADEDNDPEEHFSGREDSIPGGEPNRPDGPMDNLERAAGDLPDDDVDWTAGLPEVRVGRGGRHPGRFSHGDTEAPRIPILIPSPLRVSVSL